MKKVVIGEFYRKTFHILNSVIPLSHIYVIKDKIDMIIFLSAMLVTCFFIELIRIKNLSSYNIFKKYLFFMMRESEKKGGVTGATWVFAGALFTIIFVPKPYCLLALLFLAVGDTFAALIGINYPFINVGSKTLSGSFACFTACCVIGFSFYSEVNAVLILIGALIATFTELVSGKINDNVSVPILSGLSMYFASIYI